LTAARKSLLQRAAARPPPRRFIEEGLPGSNALLPADPFLRARARLLIDRFSGKAVPEFYKMLLRQVGPLRRGAGACRLPPAP
jgi:hypothetical protein